PIYLDDLVDSRAVTRAVNGREQFHAATKIPGSCIGRTYEVLGSTVIREDVDASMLEKSPQHAHHANSIRHTGKPWTESTQSSHHELHVDASLRCAIQRLNDLVLGQA